jgi:hypothetical protein
MSKLRFDPVTYQFYYRCRAEESEEARAAGFGWEPIRRRYYTEDPNVAVALARYGDIYVMDLLADALDTRSLPQCIGDGAPWRKYASRSRHGTSSTAVH